MNDLQGRTNEDLGEEVETSGAEHHRGGECSAHRNAGGRVGQPLMETFFAKAFGMVTDKFGVPWMIIAGVKQPQ